MNQQLIKMAVNLIGLENIKTAIKSLIEAGLQQKNKVELAENENDTVLILYEQDRKTFAALYTVDSNKDTPEIKRYISGWSIDFLIENMIKNL